MAERLKDIFFTRSSVSEMADAIVKVEGTFDRKRFLRLVFDGDWKSLELKDRMHRVARALGTTLPGPYIRALTILKEVAPRTKGFECMVFPDFVEMFGQEDWANSLSALGYFTRFGSSEFAVRPFLARDPDRVLSLMAKWAEDRDPAVRRLASEGCRPRLPWAMALPVFKKDPRPLLPILEKLKTDPDESVRRSVANNLNDIARDNPEVTLGVCERWYGRSAETDRIVKHACRGLLKAGNKRAMQLFGFSVAPPASVKNLSITPKTARIGQSVEFSFQLRVKKKKAGREKQPVRLEYRVDYARAGGRISGKVFRISERDYSPGVYAVKKKHSLADMSTRKHHPGVHRLTVVMNGTGQVGGTFVLRPAAPRSSAGVKRGRPSR